VRNAMGVLEISTKCIYLNQQHGSHVARKIIRYFKLIYVRFKLPHIPMCLLFVEIPLIYRLFHIGIEDLGCSQAAATNAPKNTSKIH